VIVKELSWQSVKGSAVGSGFGSFLAADGSGHRMVLIEHFEGTTWTILPSPNPTKGDFLSDGLFAGAVNSPSSL
jgi:hypothetical protein